MEGDKRPWKILFPILNVMEGDSQTGDLILNPLIESPVRKLFNHRARQTHLDLLYKFEMDWYIDGWMIDRLTKWMIDWTNEHWNEWPSDQMTNRKNEWNHFSRQKTVFSHVQKENFVNSNINWFKYERFSNTQTITCNMGNKTHSASESSSHFSDRGNYSAQMGCSPLLTIPGVL